MVPRVEQRADAPPGWVDSWKSGELVIILRYSDNDCRTWEYSVWGGVVSLGVRLDDSFRTEHGWYARRGMQCVPETSVNTLQKWSGRPSSCCDPFVWEKVCFGNSGDWKVWRVPVNLATDALRMISLEELHDASLCWRSKRTIAHINIKGGDCWDIAINGQ